MNGNEGRDSSSENDSENNSENGILKFIKKVKKKSPRDFGLLGGFINLIFGN